MDGARFMLLYGGGCEAFHDERDRSARAQELWAQGLRAAAWTERVLDVLVGCPATSTRVSNGARTARRAT